MISLAIRTVAGICLIQLLSTGAMAQQCALEQGIDIAMFPADDQNIIAQGYQESIPVLTVTMRERVVAAIQAPIARTTLRESVMVTTTATIALVVRNRGYAKPRGNKLTFNRFTHINLMAIQINTVAICTRSNQDSVLALDIRSLSNPADR